MIVHYVPSVRRQRQILKHLSFLLTIFGILAGFYRYFSIPALLIDFFAIKSSALLFVMLGSLLALNSSLFYYTLRQTPRLFSKIKNGISSFSSFIWDKAMGLFIKKVEHRASTPSEDGTNLLENLPNETILHILHFIPHEGAFYKTCSRFYAFKEDENRYRALLNTPEIQDDIQIPIYNLKDQEKLAEELQKETDCLLENTIKILSDLFSFKILEQRGILTGVPKSHLCQELIKNGDQEDIDLIQHLNKLEASDIEEEKFSCRFLYERNKLLNTINENLFRRSFEESAFLYIKLHLTRIPSLLFRKTEYARFKGNNQLDFSQNAIFRLPANFCGSIKLIKVDLNHNNITKLPENFQHLINLRQVRLDHNYFTDVDQLSLLPKLQSVSISHNHLENFDLPEGVMLELGGIESASKEAVLATQTKPQSQQKCAM